MAASRPGVLSAMVLNLERDAESLAIKACGRVDIGCIDDEYDDRVDWCCHFGSALSLRMRHSTRSFGERRCPVLDRSPVGAPP